MTDTPKQPKQRLVAIVGRPNVGKSAIFNRLVRRRMAIVHEESGVTRDRLISETFWGDERFDLVDTGGVPTMDDKIAADEITAGIRSQVEAALADAAVVIFVVDCTAGLIPMDEDVARLLRTSGCVTIVAANKADNPSLDSATSEFEKFGYPIFPVSALHNRGFDELMSVVLKALPPFEMSARHEPLKVAVVGRPNVGKSSFINRLLKSDRVIVSSVPGTTRDSIDIPFVVGARHYILIDTAGIRREGRIHDLVEKYSRERAERSIERADVVVLVLDAVQGPSAQDKKIAALIGERAKGCVLVVNKWDLASATTQREYEPALRKEMPFMNYCPVVFLSSKTGYNIRETVDAIDHVASQVRFNMPTGILNRTIIDAYEKVQPPIMRGGRLKIFYVTQVGCSPIRIRLYVNEPGRVTDPYTHYLTRIIRERFGLEGAPIILQFRARERRSDPGDE